MLRAVSGIGASLVMPSVFALTGERSAPAQRGKKIGVIVASLMGASVAVGVLSAILRPVLVAGSLILGWVGVLLATVLAQAVVVQIAVDLTPGMTSNSLLTGFAAGVITAVVSTVATWAATAGTQEAFIASLTRRRGLGLRRAGSATAKDGLDGVVFVQLDGVSFELARWGVNSGTLPTLARWVRTGSHDLTRWQVQVPCTTPVSQAGILHGRYDGLAAFRWFDRAAGRVIFMR